MDDPFAVSGFERPTDLQDYACGVLRRQLSLLTKNRTKVLTFEVFHRDEFEAVGLSQIENTNDVAVSNLASQDQLLLEALEDFRIGRKLRANNF